MATQRLQEAAEKAKIELSSLQETQINLPFITATSEGPKHLDVKLTRATFNELTKDLVEACKGPFEQAISDSGLSKAPSTTWSWSAGPPGSRPSRSWSSR